MDDVHQLTRALIDIPSVSGNEQAVAEYVARLLGDRGYVVELTEIAPGRSNVFARLGQARVVLCTHLDTVPPFVPSREDDRYIYGRGATDAKGIAAAQIVAAERLRESGVRDIGLLFLADEELDSRGARAANLNPLASVCRHLINGEPTMNQLAIGSKGSLRVTLATMGSGGHSAYPEHGLSAIHTLLAVLEDVRATTWPSDPTLGHTTWNVGTITGGTAANVLAPTARAELQFRCVTAPDPVLHQLRQLVADRATIEVGSASPPMRMTAHPDLPTCVVAYTTDLPHLSAWGTPHLLGPGTIADAHQPDERIAKTDLTAGVTRYESLVRSLTSGSGQR